MGDTYFVGVDIGTQGTKCAIYSDIGVLTVDAFEPSQLVRPSTGIVEEDPEVQFASVCRTISRCIGLARIRPSDIAGVAIDGQMAGTIGIGRDGLAVTPYDSWLDTRCSRWIVYMAQLAGPEILAKTGNSPSFNQGPKILYWKNEREETWTRIRAFVQPASYASMRLCGMGAEEAYVDDTHLHFSGFADNEKGGWDADLCRAFEIGVEKLPRILRPSELVGGVSGESARRSGLREGTPVLAGLGDTAASFLSCGAIQPGVCVDVSGTAAVFATTTDTFRPDKSRAILGIGRSAMSGLWHPYAYINGGGMNVLWFAGKIATGIGAEPDEAADYDTLDAVVSKIEPREDDPYFVPHMEGRAKPSDPGIRGAWAGIRWDHGLDRLYRSVLEATALEYRLYLNAMRRLYPATSFREVRATGGGTKSRAWTRIKANVLGLDYRIVEGLGAPRGACLLAAAAVAAGGNETGTARQLQSLQPAWIAQSECTVPEGDAADLYSRRFGQYERLLRALAGFPDTEERGKHDRE